MVRTKSVYEKPVFEDGFRLLIMRKWPRGIAKGAINEWRKEFSPSLGLLSDWRNGVIDWDEFSWRYQHEIVSNREAMEWLKEKATQGTVTLLCGCKDEQHCHRSLLKQLINIGGVSW